jgi:L-alanine-DL-glutamate epimerase-like enolase superfamily enzyme
VSRTTIRSATIDVARTLLRRPFVTALGTRTHTENVGVTLRLAGGASGYGEASTSLAMKHLTAAALRRALAPLCKGAVTQDARDWRRLVSHAWACAEDMSPAVAAFEAALLTALAQESQVPLCSFFGGERRRLETDLTISAWNDGAFTRTAATEAARQGFRTLKIKVGGAFDSDLARVKAVLEGAPRAGVLLDGNQGFTPRAALKFLDAAQRAGARVSLFEQPVRKDDLAGMAFVAKRAGVPVAADESVATPQQAVSALKKGAATAINIKLAKSGLSRGLEIAAVARAAGVPLMIGCMAETTRGLSASVHFAMGTGFFRFVDLDSDVLLKESAADRRGVDWSRRGRIISLK